MLLYSLLIYQLDCFKVGQESTVKWTLTNVRADPVRMEEPVLSLRLMRSSVGVRQVLPARSAKSMWMSVPTNRVPPLPCVETASTSTGQNS